MEPATPTYEELGVLRGIALAGFTYGPVMQLCASAGWELVTDEPDSGFLQFYVYLGGNRANQRLLSIMLGEGDLEPHGMLPLYNFGEDAGDPSEQDRFPFDQAYRQMAGQLAEVLGPPFRTGEYQYSHRVDWPYLYSWWRLDEASLALVQDEHDIQFGMDISLWILSPELEVGFPLLNHLSNK